MKAGHEIRRYAKILLNTIRLDAVPEAISRLSAFNSLLSGSREFRGFFENPAFKASEKETVLEKISGRLGLSRDMVRLIMRMSESKMLSRLPDVIGAVAAAYLEKKKRAKAVVVTSFDTKGNYDARLASSLRQLTGRDVDIEYVVDPSLLGGILIKVGSTMYDSSIKGQFRLLKDELLKER